jgi:hypothetical protein
MSAYIQVTPSDTTPQAGLVVALYVGGAGDVVVRAREDTAPVTLANAPAGKWLKLPSPALFIMAATSATDLVAALALSARDGGR